MQETQETQVWSLCWKDLFEKEIATHSSMFAWKIPWTEEPGGYSPCDHRVGHNWACTHKVNKTWTALLSLCYSFWYLHACILVSLEEKWGRESNICCVFATCQTLYLLMILFSVHSILFRVSLVAWLVKNLPVMRDTWVRSLGWEDTLEKGKATNSSILAWGIPYTVQSMGWQRVRHDWMTFTFIVHFPVWIWTLGHRKQILKANFLQNTLF